MKVPKQTERNPQNVTKHRWHDVLIARSTSRQRSSPHAKRSYDTTPQVAGYTRYPKPPYTYMGMIAAAIVSSPNKQATVEHIYSQLQGMFSFFSGIYTGWKSSVRHFLTIHDCFELVKDPGTPKKSKFLEWKLVPVLLPKHAFTLQNTKEALTGNYASHLFDHLNMDKLQIHQANATGTVRRLVSYHSPASQSNRENMDVKFPAQRRLSFELEDGPDVNNNSGSLYKWKDQASLLNCKSDGYSCETRSAGLCIQETYCHVCYHTNELMLLANVASQMSYL